MVRTLVVAAFVISLPAPARAEAPADARRDAHSYAEPARVRTQDLALDLTVDFRAKRLVGTATLALEWLDPAARALVLDTRDLQITKVEVGDGATWKPARFTLGKRHPRLGRKLTVQARAPKVRIAYRTSPQASGLQWMGAQLTADKRQPLLFSQSQAIHARSWVPLQDTPSVRFTYSARVKTPRGVVALMSADNDPAVVRDGDYSFRMAQPIPSYLLALAVGDFAFKPISARAGVWAEPSVVDTAVAEFADTEKMIVATERLYGPYRWERYDLLVLPASFPFGGMENPRLSFLTPTVLVGDKSLVGLIAHELAHSWSGNLVTNATWRDVWLNEGFTTYVEGRIVEVVYGRALADMEAVLAQTGLRARIAELPATQQRLRTPAGGDADEGSAVAYEKGQWFLQALEQRFGRAVFDPFLRRWFDRHAFQSVTTDDFLAFVRAELMPAKPGALTDAELRAWVDGEGIPASAPVATSARLRAVDDARAKWLAGGAKLADLVRPAWSTQERVHFLEGLPPTLAPAQLTELDGAMQLTGTRNAELAQRWYPLAVRSRYAPARDPLAAFVVRVGRLKLIMPIFSALVETRDGHAFARTIFQRARRGYHPITIGAVEGLLAKSAKQLAAPKQSGKAANAAKAAR